MKKGQVTALIIVAVLIVVVVGVFFYLNQETRDEIIVDPDIVPIHSLVSECIEIVGKDAVFSIGLKGGWNEPEDEVLGIGVYFDKGVNNMPSIEEVEGEINDYINRNLGFCVADFRGLSDFEVSEGEVSTTSEIMEEKVEYKVNFPINIKKGEKSYVLEDFFGETNVRLGEILKVNEEYMKEQIEQPRGICLSCLYSLSEDHGLRFETNDYDNETVIFTVIDPTLNLEGESVYLFNYVNRYEVIDEREGLF